MPRGIYPRKKKAAKKAHRKTAVNIDISHLTNKGPMLAPMSAVAEAEHRELEAYRIFFQILKMALEK
jgi:hypothetical protein